MECSSFPSSPEGVVLVTYRKDKTYHEEENEDEATELAQLQI